MTEETKRKIIESRRRNRYATHKAKLDALHIHDIMVRVARGDYN